MRNLVEYPITKDEMFEALTRIARRRIHIGYFDSSAEAGKAYDAAAAKYFGPFARTNSSSAP